MISFTIHHRDKTESTNLDAISLAKNGAPSGTVVVANEQTHGSGRRGRYWHSPKGNLYFSIVLKEPISIPVVSLASALSVGTTLEKIFASYDRELETVPTINYKWPNDVLVDGRKICGVLLQAESKGSKVSWLVCGIGLNVRSCPQYATCIYDHIPEFALPTDELLNIILGNLTKLINLFLADGFAPLRKLWLGRAYKINETVSISTSSGILHEGKFVALGINGSLVLESSTGIVEVDYGEIL